MEILQKHDVSMLIILIVTVAILAIVGISAIIHSANNDKNLSEKNKKSTTRLGLGSIVFIIVFSIVTVYFIPERYDAIVTDISDVYDQGYEIVDINKDTGVYTIQKRN